MIIRRPGINCCSVLDHLEKKVAGDMLAVSVNPSHRIALMGNCPILNGNHPRVSVALERCQGYTAASPGYLDGSVFSKG